MDYPKRDSHFAHRAFRIMHKSCAAADMGRDAFAIVAVVLHTEDAARYRKPVTFWNSQLMETLGFTKWDTFDRARRRAIDAGWLVYESVGRRKAGRYYVTIPSELEGLSDAPLEEDIAPAIISDNGGNSGDKAGVNKGIKRGQSGVQSGDNVGEPFYPVPNPVPNPNPKAKPDGLACDSPADVASKPPPSGTGYIFATQSGAWELPARKLAEYEACYPFDVAAELRKAAQWLRDNPARRKSKGGMPAFLTRWLNSEHDKRGSPSSKTNGRETNAESWERLKAMMDGGAK